MSEAPSGGTITILRVTEEAEEDARLLTFLQENGVRPGHVFDVVDVAEHIGTMTLRRVDGGADGWPRGHDWAGQRPPSCASSRDEPISRCSTGSRSGPGSPRPAEGVC